MQEENNLNKIEWQNDDVIAFSEQDIIKLSQLFDTMERSIKDSELGRTFRQKLDHKIRISKNSTIPISKSSNQWFEEGVDCKILRADNTKGWRKGKIRVKLNIEFELWEETEEADSPLDNFRNEES